MVAESLNRKKVYPCNDASAEELTEVVWQVGEHKKSDYAAKLRSITYQVLPNQISWDNIRYLSILGSANRLCNTLLTKAGFEPSMYVNHRGDRLIMVHMDDILIQQYAGYFAEQLQILEIYNTTISSVNLRIFPNLEQLLITGNKQLFTMPGLNELSKLVYLNICECNNPPEISRLSELPQLATLLIQDCKQLTNVPNLDKLTQLNRLVLRGFDNFREITGLDKLTQLTSLEIDNCSNLTTLPELENLIHLTSLEITNCGMLTALPELKNLKQLKTLSLSQCNSLTEFPNLENLLQLTEINLSKCGSLARLRNLKNLPLLVRINLSECSNLTVLPSLDRLTSLNELNLSGCGRLTTLPGLDKLTSLNELNLSNCRRLTALSDLDKLTSLNELILSNCSSLTALPSLDKLTQLIGLNLSGCCSLTQLPELKYLTQLLSLDLSDMPITELPQSISEIETLRYLDLSGLHLKECPFFLPDVASQFITGSDIDKLVFKIDMRIAVLECREKSVSEKNVGQKLDGDNRPKAQVALFGTSIDGMDMSIFEQSHDLVVAWFNNHHPLNEIKVVFLGDGEAGKSHTIARLMNDGGDPDYANYDGQSTPGIVIRNKKYDLGGRKIQVHYWDFGGQEIMHSMHRIFLTGRTMYVILLNARDDTQSDRAKYWLHNVKSFAPNSPVLLVLNKIDQNESASVDERDLRSRYDKLTQVVKLSAKDFSKDQFNNRFTSVLMGEIQKTGFLDTQWPTAWTEVKEKLENMETHYIMGSDYQALCQECKVDDKQKKLLHWFNDLGISFCCDGEDDYTLEDYVILRPDWITNALYIILFNTLKGARNGLIPHKSIYTLLKNAHNTPEIRCTLPQAKYTSGDIDYVLRIMRKFNLSFTDGHDNEFIPMLCQQNSMLDIQYYQRDAEILEFNMEFDYLPNNLLHRLMVERYSELDMATVWRTGARFKLKELGYSAVVVIDSNTLRFFIRHDNPMHRPNTYLTMLKAHVDRIVEKMDLKAPICKLIYKLDGSRDVFDFEMLKLRLEVGQTHELAASHRKMIPIADILNQSAPDGLEDEKKLLNAIRKSCLNIQAEPDYYLNGNETGRGMEDKRNRRIRDDLQMLGYDVKDQTQRGLSGTGRGIGELDLLLLNDKKEPWTIIEALRVSNGTKTEWDKHLNKLVKNYNYFGAPCVYLLTYVDADITNFQRIWSGYKDHIPNHNPGKFTYCDNSLVVQNDVDGLQYVKTATCRYDRGGQVTTAYHIFVRIPKQNEIIP